jgi:LacI family transcriptional regulator
MAGVSLATVDRVLNRPSRRARGDDRARVEDAIARLGYVRDVAAANLAKRRTYPLVFVHAGRPEPLHARAGGGA